MMQAPPTLDALLLLGFMEKDEAIPYLLEQCWFDPALSNQQAEELWKKYREKVELLPDRKVERPAQYSIPPSRQALVGDFLRRLKGPEVLRVININPLNLLVYQFYVVADRADHHAQHIGGVNW